MSNTLTFKSPSPNQTFHLTADNRITTDAAGLCTIPAGTDLARSLIAFGWTIVAAVPTVDPHVPGAVWNNGGALTISAG